MSNNYLDAAGIKARVLAVIRMIREEAVSAHRTSRSGVVGRRG